MRVLAGVGLVVGLVVAVVDPTIFAAAVVTVLSALTIAVNSVIKSFSDARERRDAAAERKADREAAAVAAKELSDKADAAAEALSAVIAKADVIKGSVDGTASKNDAKLDATLKELEFMRRMYNEQKQTAAVLAVTTAASSATQAMAPLAGDAPLQDLKDKP